MCTNLYFQAPNILAPLATTSIQDKNPKVFFAGHPV